MRFLNSCDWNYLIKGEDQGIPQISETAWKKCIFIPRTHSLILLMRLVLIEVLMWRWAQRIFGSQARAWRRKGLGLLITLLLKRQHRGQALHCTALYIAQVHGCSAQHWTSVRLYYAAPHTALLHRTQNYVFCFSKWTTQGTSATVHYIDLCTARTLHTAQDWAVEKEQHREQVLDWTELHITQHCTAHKRGNTRDKCCTT